MTAAWRGRELGASVALIERDHSLGGTCTNDGCVPTRVLAKAARLLRETEQLSDYGIDAQPNPSSTSRAFWPRHSRSSIRCTRRSSC